VKIRGCFHIACCVREAFLPRNDRPFLPGRSDGSLDKLLPRDRMSHRFQRVVLRVRERASGRSFKVQTLATGSHGDAKRFVSDAKDQVKKMDVPSSYVHPLSACRDAENVDAQQQKRRAKRKRENALDQATVFPLIELSGWREDPKGSWPLARRFDLIASPFHDRRTRDVPTTTRRRGFARVAASWLILNSRHGGAAPTSGPYTSRQSAPIRAAARFYVL